MPLTNIDASDRLDVFNNNTRLLGVNNDILKEVALSFVWTHVAIDKMLNVINVSLFVGESKDML